MSSKPLFANFFVAAATVAFVLADEAMYIAKRSGRNQFFEGGRAAGREGVGRSSNCQWWTLTNQTAILADKMQDERIGSRTPPP